MSFVTLCRYGVAHLLGETEFIQRAGIAASLDYPISGYWFLAMISRCAGFGTTWLGRKDMRFKIDLGLTLRVGCARSGANYPTDDTERQSTVTLKPQSWPTADQSTGLAM